MFGTSLMSYREEDALPGDLALEPFIYDFSNLFT